MAYRNKGSMAATVTVSREPDRSGNFICDGIADNVQITEAIAYVSTLGGGDVFVKRGTYDIAVPFIVLANVTLRGTGWESILRLANATNPLGYIIGMNQYSALKDITVDGNQANQAYDATRTNWDAVEFLGDNVTVKNVEVMENTAGSGININVHDDCRILNNFIHDCGTGAVPCDGIFNGQPVARNIISGNVIDTVTDVGIANDKTTDCLVEGNIINATTSMGITLGGTGEGTIIIENIIILAGSLGIQLTELDDLLPTKFNISNNIILSSTGDGIGCVTTNDALEDGIIQGNLIDGGIEGIDLFGASGTENISNILVSNNFVTDCASIGIRGQFFVESIIEGNIIENAGIDGIQLVAGSNNNTISNNRVIGSTQNGIHVAANSNNNAIIGNTSNENTRNGILLDNADNNRIVGNACNGNDSGDTNTYDGINITGGSDDNLIHLNICNSNDRYGINIADANADRTWVKNNQLRLNTTAPFNDAGTDTKLATMKGDFTHHDATSAGWTAPVINTTPGGIDIDADAEFAYTHITLPEELQQVVRIKYWAYSNVAEAANNMLLQLNAHGATSSEVWSGNPIDVASHPSEETGGIAVGDVIHWLIDATDDAQIGTLTAQDYMELLAIGEAAGAPDIATDALFGGWEIEYV